MKIICTLFDDSSKKILNIKSQYNDKKTENVIIEIEDKYITVNAKELIDSIVMCSDFNK